MTDPLRRGRRKRRLTQGPTGSPFDGEFLRRLEVLRVAARRLVREGRWRHLRERRQGPGLEFAEHRDYSPGDEIRRIDWSAYARLDRAKVRVFEESEPPPVAILIDASASMAGEPFLAALRLAAGIGAIALAHLGPLIVAPFAASVGPQLGPLRGASAVPALLRRLAELRPADRGGTRLAAAIRAASKGRKGASVIISDFLDAGPIERSILPRRGWRLILLQCDPPEPEIDGVLTLRDRETDEAIRRTISPEAREGHRLRVDAAARRLEAECRQSGAGAVRLPWGTPFDEGALAVFEELLCVTP